MVASVASDVIQHRRKETCFSYYEESPSSGDKVTLVDCDPTDTKLSNWVVTPVSGSQETNNEIVQFCIQGGNLCIGTIKGALNPHLSIVLLDQDSTDTSQQWTVNPSKRQSFNTYANVQSEKCMHIDGAGRLASIITSDCSGGDKRQHFIVTADFNKRF